MTAHVRYPALDPRPRVPATLSSTILVDRLREKMGFGGLLLSDAVIMEGVLQHGTLSEEEASVRCLEAGCDLVLHPTDAHAVASALERAAEAGRIDLLSVEGRLRLTLADLVVDSPERGSVRDEYAYASYAMARDSLTALRNEAGLLPLDPSRKRSVLAVLVDDDGEPRRAESFRERAGEFAAGFLYVDAAAAASIEAPLRVAVEDAEVVFLAVACSIRAWKGRVGLRPEPAAVVSSILRLAPTRTICVLLTAPAALTGVEPTPATLVGAWGEAPVCIRAAIDVLLQGGPLRGVDPTDLGTP
jgi:beta-glucosidase-like glycosyl hydrolase